MGSLVDQTEASLACVLSLCSGGVGQQDVDALQRHDETTLALLDISEDDSVEAIRAWIKCLETWSRKGRTTNQGEQGPWTTITQPCAEVLSRANPSPGAPRTTDGGAPPIPAHKALTVVLFRAMLLGDEADGSPHRRPAAAAWAAARAYLLMLSLPGAAAYGVLQPAALGMVLTNLRSWCRNSSVYRQGGGAGEKKKAPQKRRRGEDVGGADESDDGDESDGDAGGRRAAGRASGDEAQACLKLLKTCLACVPLSSHQDLAVKLSEVLVGVSVIAAVEGPASLADLASASMVGLVTGASGHAEAIHGAVLQALMPVILMATGKGDAPPRSRDCIKAHQSAIEITKTIAAALRHANANEAKAVAESLARNSIANASSPPTTPGQHTDAAYDEQGKERDSHSPPSAATPAREGEKHTAADPPATDNTPPAGSGGSIRVVVGQKKRGEEEGRGKGGRPVLTLMQHLCASAPERAEGRAKVADGLSALLPEVEESDRARFVAFLAKLSRSAKILHRGFAVELSSRLLTEGWPWVSSNDNNSNGNSNGGVASPGASPSPSPGPVVVDAGGKTMLGLVVARAADTAPTVRSKAASTLAEVLSGIQEGRSGYKGEAFKQAVKEACGRGGAGEDGPLLEIVRSRVEDEKANVRRNAVPALEALLKLSPAFRGGGRVGGGAVGKEYEADFMLLQERCNDVSLSTRKAAMGALSSLLMLKPWDESLQNAWVSSVLPLAGDPEQTCQNRLVELVRTVLLDRVVDWYKAEVVTTASKAKSNGRGTSIRRAARGGDGVGTAPEGNGTPPVAAEDEEQVERVASVWALLAKTGEGDAQKCLKKAVSTLMLQKGSTGFKAAPLLEALRAAAVMALPPKATRANADTDAAATESSEGGLAGMDAETPPAEEEGEEEEEEWAPEDLRLLSLAENLPQASLTVIRRGTWVLLEAFLDRTRGPGGGPGESSLEEPPDMDPMFVVKCWNRIRGHILEEALSETGANGSSSPASEDAFESDGRRVLGVLARLAASVPPEVAQPLAHKLLEMLLDLVARPETSAALVAALHMLCLAQASTEEAGAAMCNEWANEALSAFERLLDIFVYQGSEALRDHNGARACGFDMALLVERLVFAVGEVVLVGFTAKEDAAGPSDPQAPPRSGKGGSAKAKEITVRPTASPRLVKLVQVLLPPRLPTSAHGVEEGEEGPETPSAVRALAFVTLGKLCLRDKALAKRSVNLFVRELETAAAPAVRSNALVVLGDLTVRYTAMVDRHMAAMAACLQDSHPLVRRHAILLISQLLLQDYVKWRGLLLYRFLATLVDSDASVRNLGAFTLTRPLITKTPGLFAQNFVETLFVLNNYSEHPCYAAAAAGRADAGGGVTMDGIDLGGDSPAQIRKRMAVYSTMLDHMSDEHKITVTAKLAQEVLSAAIDGGLPLASSSAASSKSSALGSGEKKSASLEGRKKASAVVKDALTIMASPGIRVGAGRGGSASTGDVDDGAEDMGQQSGPGGLAAAKRNLLSKVALKHLMEKVVPVLTALKHVLERAHSPLLREMMFYLGELFRSHKEEVKAVLASEPGLVEEIDFDLRRFEKEEHERRQKAKEAAAMAAASAAAAAGSGMGPPRTPGRRTPGRRRSSMGGSISVMRDVSTPMAAVLQSARKTPFQNLGACSAVKLKASAATSTSTPGASSTSIFSPVRSKTGGGGASRGPRPKTPTHLRTPRQAVAAALGNSPMDTDTASNPIPMRSMLGRTDNVGASAPFASNRGGGRGGADIELASPVNPHPAKRRRWSVSVPPPAAEDERDDASDEEEFDGGVAAREGGVVRPPGEETDDDGDVDGEREVGKENNPNNGSTATTPSDGMDDLPSKKGGKGRSGKDKGAKESGAGAEEGAIKLGKVTTGSRKGKGKTAASKTKAVKTAKVPSRRSRAAAKA
eukprot:g7274.t1